MIVLWCILATVAYLILGVLIVDWSSELWDGPTLEDAARDKVEAGFLLFFALAWPVGFGLVLIALLSILPAKGLQCLARALVR